MEITRYQFYHCQGGFLEAMLDITIDHHIVLENIKILGPRGNPRVIFPSNWMVPFGNLDSPHALNLLRQELNHAITRRYLELIKSQRGAKSAIAAPSAPSPANPRDKDDPRIRS